MGMREGRESPWALVLAAGDGTRLRALTTTADGLVVPKQFCAFGATKTLLGVTLDRAWGLVPSERVIAVVAEQHRPWWSDELAGLQPWNVIVQPVNRGTAPGLLLPLLHVAARDPEAVVIVLPSDHHVEDDSVLQASLRQAVRAARREPEAVVLLGVTPDEPDSEYGWIIPGERTADGARRVESFVEKPDRGWAARLMAQGGLWSSFVMVARCSALLSLYEKALPDLLRAFHGRRDDVLARGSGPTAGLRELYSELGALDFSRLVLETAREQLRVVTVPACGWSDLGTPERVVRWMSRRGLRVAPSLAAGRTPPPPAPERIVHAV